MADLVDAMRRLAPGDVNAAKERLRAHDLKLVKEEVDRRNRRELLGQQLSR